MNVVQTAGLELSAFVAMNHVQLLQPSDINSPTTTTPFTVITPNPLAEDIAISRMLLRLHLHDIPAVGINQVDIVVARASDGMLLDGMGMDWSSGSPSHVPITPPAAGKEVDRMYWPHFYRLKAGDALVVQLWYFSDSGVSITVGGFAGIVYTPMSAVIQPPSSGVSVVEAFLVPSGSTSTAPNVFFVFSDGTVKQTAISPPDTRIKPT